MQLALAMINYQDEHHGRLPPAVVYGADGEPLYSWRVLLLPYIGEKELYEQFHLDEPWDSPHNLALLPKMPATYAPPPGKAWKVPPHHTVCHVFVGKGAAFEGREGLRYPSDFPDGTSNTLLLVEAGEPVPWTKPQDLPYAPDQPLPPLDGLFGDGSRAAFADGHIQFIRKRTSEASLRAAVTRNGGEGLKGVEGLGGWAGSRAGMAVAAPVRRGDSLQARRRKEQSMANEPKPHPEKTGVWNGPNPRPAGEGVPLTTDVPSAGTTSAPGPGHITDEDAWKDQAARTGQGGLGTAGTPAEQGKSSDTPGQANTPGGALNTGPGAGGRGLGTNG